MGDSRGKPRCAGRPHGVQELLDLLNVKRKKWGVHTDTPLFASVYWVQSLEAPPVAAVM